MSIIPNEQSQYYFKPKVFNGNGTEIIILFSMPVKKKFDFDSIRSKYLKAIFKTPYIYPELLFTLFQMAHCEIIVPVTTSSVSLFRVVTQT